ncbi:rab effector MyRIP-like isoform X1 [Seriola aureovittata]|uniref:rab effector MyRIP-like isoform X1 n=1 Tax=Seriola aureovittata TaxID=2871759 RepID=UPI0024BD771C|nr:rab effector MyRIP-like isoform X1 [Seriola aureovittata]
MGRKLDLSGLTDNEAEHVLQVVQRDMKLRKKEEERLSELKQELDEEGSRCLLLSRQSCFNQRCCIRCCLPFTFLLNPRRQCQDCCYNVCKACRVYSKRDKAWLCSVCQKSRLLRTQSLEWFYTNVKKRFKRFGSAKVLKTLYRKHLAEHSALSELTEGSAYEESVCNEGSVCESDSTFYRQSEAHSMAETLTVALRVAEEAVDEAISKAEFDTANQEKQNEAHYLREHRGELIAELAKTIVQKIVSRRKTLAEMRTECDQDWPLEQNADPRHPQPTCDQASSSLKHQPGLWRSHSASSLLDNDPPGLIQDSLQAFKKEGGGSTISAWKSVDRLDNAGVSSVLKSPDGNWIALQSAQLSRPSLLTRRKSLVFSALERESGVVSAYEGMGSDNETKSEPDSSWGAVLQEIHRKMTDSNFNLQDPRDRTQLPLMGRRGSRDDMFSDSEGNWKPNKPLLAFFKRNMPAEIRRPSSSGRTSVIDVNFNVEGAGEEEESSVAAALEVGKVRRSRKKRKSKKEQVASSSVSDLNKEDNQSQPISDAVTPDTLTSGATTPEPFDLESDMAGHGASQMDEMLTLKLQQLAVRVCDSSTQEEVLDKDLDCGDDGPGEERRQGSEDKDGERLWKMEIDLDEVRMEDEKEDEERDLEVDDEEMKHRLYRLVAQSRLTYFSSTDDDLNKAGQSEGEWDENIEEDGEQEEEMTEGLTYKLCQLENEVRATQFSSTEDELDRVGIEEKKTEEEDGRNEELAVKVCRLAKQVSATQFSSTEDELDRAGRGKEGEEAIDEETLWKLQEEKAVQAAQLRDLASLVSASQFSSTEDELDRIGKNEGDGEQEVTKRGTESSVEREDVWGGAVERRESFGKLDVKMFDLRDETEETKTESSDEKATAENVLVGEIKTDDVQLGKTQKREEPEERVCECEAVKAQQKRQVMKLKSAMEAEKTEEIIDSNETREEQGYQPEAKWPDENEGEDKFNKEGQGKWEATADSEEEDPEFDRIISSMLMMTLEDMQVETLKNKAEGNGRINRELEETETEASVKIGRESGFKEKVVDEQTADASEERGSAKEPQSQGDNVTSELAARERPEENATEQIGGNTSRKDRSGEVTSRNENEQEDTDMDRRERRNLAFETNEAQQKCKRIEVDDEEEDDGGGKMVTEWQMMETQGVAAEGECKNKEVDEKSEETKEKSANDTEQSSTSPPQESLLSPEEIQNGSEIELYKTVQFISSLLEQRYSAVSLRSITTEVLKVLNATEELLQGVEGGDNTRLSSTSLPPNTDLKKLDQQFSRLEENVYVAAGSVYSLEAELSDLEECARGICSSTSDMELSFLEEQVASAAAKVQQSELQICDISARIAALKSAGLNVDTQSHVTKTRTIPVMPVTLDSSRQLRRRLPAPPVKEDKET